MRLLTKRTSRPDKHCHSSENSRWNGSFLYILAHHSSDWLPNCMFALHLHRQGSHNPQVLHRVWLGSDSLSNPREARPSETMWLFDISANTPELRKNPQTRPFFYSKKRSLEHFAEHRNHSLFSVTCCFSFTFRVSCPGREKVSRKPWGGGRGCGSNPLSGYVLYSQGSRRTWSYTIQMCKAQGAILALTRWKRVVKCNKWRQKENNNMTNTLFLTPFLYWHCSFTADTNILLTN
jgi:hypothetical protein